MAFFLSRLCGGEAEWIAKSLVDEFLSRLCGGEVPPSVHQS